MVRWSTKEGLRIEAIAALGASAALDANIQGMYKVGMLTHKNKNQGAPTHEPACSCGTKNEG